jgi:hypothetical protein
MKYFLSAVMVAGWFCLAMAAFAQSTGAPQATPSPAPSASPAAAAAAPAPASPAAGGGGGKRGECLVAVADKKGQDRQDAMQLCLAQGHIDCLKQAIDQKIANAQRKDFIKTCMREE